MTTDVVFVAGRDPLREVSGGHSSFVRAHGRAALAAGYRPQLFCAAPAAGREETAFGTIHRVASPLRPFRQLMIAGHARPLAAAIERFAVERDGAGGAAPRPPLVVHGFGVWSYAGLVAVRRLARRGIAAVLVVSSYTTYEEEARSKVRASRGDAAGRRLACQAEHLWIRLAAEPYERRAYLGSRQLLVNYDSVHRLIEAKYGRTPHCRKVGYGSEAAFLAASGPPPISAPGTAPITAPARPLIAAISRHDPRKGVDVLLHALARLAQAGIPFRACLAGDGPLLGDHRRLAERLGLGGVVEIPGQIPDIASLLAAADVFALPSREEQSGSLAVLEALQVGLPIVASCVDGIPEDVEDGESAILVAPGDPDALAGALARLLGDEALRARLAAGARRRFDERFSAARFAATMGGIYRELEAQAAG